MKCCMLLHSVEKILLKLKVPKVWCFMMTRNAYCYISLLECILPHMCLSRCSGYRGIPVHLLLGPIISPSSAQGRTDDLSYSRRPSWGGASWGERRWKLLRTRRPPHELPLVRRGVTSTSAQHVGVQSKKIKGRRPRTAHATPDREETNFRCACPKRHSGCWPPP
jgi:hypothetical protein